MQSELPNRFLNQKIKKFNRGRGSTSHGSGGVRHPREHAHGYESSRHAHEHARAYLNRDNT